MMSFKGTKMQSKITLQQYMLMKSMPLPTIIEELLISTCKSTRKLKKIT